MSVMHASSLSACEPCDVDKFATIQIPERVAIKPFVLSLGLEWTKGAAHYQFTKTETVQTYKNIVARDDETLTLYEGPALRYLLGFRDENDEGGVVKSLRLKPKSFDGITLFVQSTSVNRVLLPGTVLLYHVSEADKAVLGFRPEDALVSAKALSSSRSRMSSFLSAHDVGDDGGVGGVGGSKGGGKGVGAGAGAGVGEMEEPVVNAGYAAAPGFGTGGGGPVLDVPTTVDEVGTFVRDLGLGDTYAEVFVREEIDGEVLMDLTLSELKELGLSMGAAKKIMRAREMAAGTMALPSSSMASASKAGSSSPGSSTVLPEWEIPLSTLKLITEVGAGAYGKVFKGKWRGAVVAVKMLAMRVVDDEQLENFRREAAIMTKLRHPNVLALLGVSSTLPNLALVAEFCDGGSLDSYLYNPDIVISDLHKLKLVIGMAAGMTYLASQGVVHRDLAARNILVTMSGEAKISDFGMSRQDLLPKNTTAESVGPLKWMAPEALRGEYSEATDVWSFGITVWELVHESLPYPDMSAIEVATQVLSGTLPLVIDPGVVDAWRELIMGCCIWDPVTRPMFADILAHVSSLGRGAGIIQDDGDDEKGDEEEE